MIWQKRARLVVAIVGIACLVAVYVGLRRRPASVPQQTLKRLDPTAVAESTNGLLQQFRSLTKDYDIRSAHQLTYKDGSSKLLDVTIKVARRGGRDFVVRAREAQAGKDQTRLLLIGDVTVEASDGFRLATGKAVFNKDAGIVEADGPATFSRGRMTGSGTGVSYDQNRDILSIAADANVAITDDTGNTSMAFRASSATLDRIKDILALDGAVHVLRGEQVMEAESARAQLSAKDEFVTFVGLTGRARVEGGSDALDAMSADAIDLDYGDAGEMLQRVSLRGTGAIAMNGGNGAPGRQVMGDALDVRLGADGSVSRVQGRGHVGMVLPASPDATARRIRADTLDATGDAGKGLTEAGFTGAVEYREDGQPGVEPRTVHSTALTVGLNESRIDRATFTGGVVFEEKGFRATAAQARYDPNSGQLDLSGGETRVPCVTDDDIAIEARSIGVALADHRMMATGDVKTVLLPRTPSPASGALRCGGGATSTATSRSPAAPDAGASSRLPGLLKQDQSANVNADALVYAGDGGRATYTGHATLVQGDTALRADIITIDQKNGDLRAVGAARFRMVLDDGAAIGTADEITYDDARRAIVYDMQPAVAAGPSDRARGVAPGGRVTALAAPTRALAHLAGPGPQDDLQAERIEMILAPGSSALQRLDATGHVRADVDRHRATGTRLVYRADTGQYDMTGTALAPVRVVYGCREATGKTLTFFKSTDRIIVDGSDEIVTRTTSDGGSCQGAPSTPGQNNTAPTRTGPTKTAPTNTTPTTPPSR